MNRFLFFFSIGITVPYVLWAVTVTEIINEFTSVIDVFVKAAVAVALLVFIVGIVKMLISLNTGNTTDDVIAKGKEHVLWGLVGLFVMVSIWGIISLYGTLFGVSLTTNNKSTPVIEIK